MLTNKNLFSNACKLVLCTVLLSTLFSCDTPQGERHKKDGYSIIEIDSCEYIEVSNWVGSQSGYYSITHKGNCKYCTQRNSK